MELHLRDGFLPSRTDDASKSIRLGYLFNSSLPGIGHSCSNNWVVLYKYRSEIISQTGLIVSAIGFILLATMGSMISYIDAILPFALIGAGMGIFASPNGAPIMNSVPQIEEG